MNGTAISWNKAAELLLGYTAAAIIGRSIFTIIPPELQGEEDEILRKLGSGQRIEPTKPGAGGRTERSSTFH